MGAKTEYVIREIVKNGQAKWEVNFGRDENGVRRRPYFHSEAEAEKAIADFKKTQKASGDFWARLNTPERQMIASAVTEMKGLRVTVREVLEDWKRWRKNNQQTIVVPMAYEKAVDEWKRRKEVAGKTERYIRDSASMMMKFGGGREQQAIHLIQPAELEEFLDKHSEWSLSSRRTNMSLFSGLWEVAIAKGWASINIVDRLEPVGKISREVRIHDNKTVLKLMSAVMENEATSSRVLVVLALGFFGCMRPEEVLSKKALANGDTPFSWEDIDLEHGLVTVRREVAKTGDQRTIRLQPVALEWLKLAKQLGNPLPPLNERRLRVQVAELIGFKIGREDSDWERDGMRKNCATHLRAVYKNDYDVVKDCGNSVRILLKHYADLHTPESVSLDYWKISPQKVEDYRKTEEWRQVLIEASKQIGPQEP